MQVWHPVCISTVMVSQSQVISIQPRKFHRSWVLAVVATLAAFPANLAAQAQAKDACSLLRMDEVQSLGSSAKISDGVSTTDQLGSVVCTYRWTAGTNAASARNQFQVINGDPNRMFPAVAPAQIKEGLLRPANQGQANASVVPGIGDACIFKSDSPTTADVTAYVKGRVLTVSVKGPDARSRKDQLVALLKIAASRL
jgi:hypothetical protein